MWRNRWFRIGLDLVLAAAVCLGGYRVAHRHLVMIDTPTFISWELKPAVMLACGYGFTQPGQPTPAADQFIARKSGTISCQEFAWGGAPVAPPGIAFANRYSLYGAAWAMRLRGISWETLDAYLAFLYGLSMVFVFATYRMAAGHVLALAGTIAVACSPMLIEIVAIRDFIKLPCFTALWLVLAWVVRDGLRRGPAATILPMTIGGALLGVGIGLRMDALVCLPVFVGVVLLAVPGFTWHALGLKTAASAACVAMFLLAGRPILTTLAEGSNSAHFAVLGLTTAFDGLLVIDKAPYDIGAQYGDGYAYAVISTHAMVAQGETLPTLGRADYDRVGWRLLRSLAASFPSDVVTRALGATWQIFRYPFERRVQEIAGTMPVFRETSSTRRAVEWRTSALAPFAEHEVALVLGVLVMASAFNWRLGVLGLALILYFCGYTMLQFSRRHGFHLDVLPIFTVVLAVQLPWLLVWRIGARFRESRDGGMAAARSYAREMAIGAIALFAAIGVFLAGLSGLRWWQDRRAVQLFDAALAQEWVPVTATEESLTDTILVNGRPVASWYNIYLANPELWNDARLLRVDGVVPLGKEADHTGGLHLQYFKVTLDDRCQSKQVTIGLQYTGSAHTTDYEYTRAFTVSVRAGSSAFVMTPAYYGLGPTWTRFDGFGVPANQRSCVTRIERAADPKTMPNPVLAVALSPDWRTERLHQRLLDRPRVSAALTAVDPLPDEERAHRSGWRRRANAPLARAVPPLDAWSRGDDVSVTRQRDAFLVVTNRIQSGYQLVSPALDVPPHHVVAVQIVGRLNRGEICVGILDGTQQKWLLAPSDPRDGLLADTGQYAQVRLVFSNCANPPGEFTVGGITYETFPKR